MRKLLLLACALLLSLGTILGQGNYGFNYSVGTYAEISGGISLGTATTDDERFVDPANLGGSTTTLTGPGFDIGFNFTYGGQVFNRIAVNANGWISLGNSSLTPAVNINTSSAYTPLGSTTAITPDYLVSRIAGLGRDLQAQADASIRIETIGDAPNRICVIQWKNYRKYLAVGDSYNFQIRLLEGSNYVEIAYGTMTNNATSTVAEVGLRGAPATTATNFHNRTTTTDWSATTKGALVTNTSTLSSTVFPVSGATFTFSPPPPCTTPEKQPTDLVLTPALNSISGSFTAEEGVTDYLVVRSLNNSLSSDPVDGVIYSIGASLGGGTVDYFGSGTAFNSTLLTINTTYYYFVFSANHSTCTGGPLYFIDSPLENNATTLSPGEIVSASSGLWSSPGTWVGGIAPTATDNATILDGHAVTVDAATNTCYSLTINSGGTVDVTGITNKLTINNNLTNNGTLDLYNAAGTAYCDLTFIGAINSTFSGSGAVTDLHTLTINKGSGTVTTASPVLEVMPSNLTIKNSASSTATTGSFLQTATFNGIVKFSGNYTITNAIFLTAAYSIPSTGGVWLNNPNFTVAGLNGSPTMSGLLRISNGTYNIGTSTGNSMGFSTGSKIYIEGGAVTATGRFGVNSSANTIIYEQSGGDITVCTVGNTSTLYASFDLGTSSTSILNLTGGTITVQLANTAISGPRDFRGGSTAVIWQNYTGTTLNLGNSLSGASKTFFLGGAVPPMIITTTSATHNVSLGSSVYYFGSLIIPTGSTLNLNGFGFWCSEDVTNEGTITGTVTGSRFDFAGGLLRSSQTYSGSGAFGTASAPVLSTAFNNSAGVTLNSPIYSMRANMFLGTLNNSNNLTLGNGTTGSVVVQIGVVLDAPGGNFDTYPTLNLGTGTYTILYSSESIARTTSYEIPLSRAVTNVSINNPNGVTLTGGDITLGSSTVLGTLTLTSGILHTGSNNVILANTGTTIIGGSATSYINGKLLRSFAANLTATGTYTTATFYPIGKGSTYLPLYIDPTTNAGGTVTISGEAFLSNSGSYGAGVTTLSDNRWEALITAGNANFTSAFLRIGDVAIVTGNQILQASSAAGVYGAIPSSSVFAAGTPNTLTTTGVQIPAASYNGYFAYGNLTECGVPAAQPTDFVVSFLMATGFTGSYTAPAPVPSNYLVVRYPSGGIVTDPVNFTSYSVGAALGAGTVRFSGTSTTFIETGLTANTTYDYYVYSFNSAGCYGPVYLITSPLFSSVSTCATAVAAPGTPTASNVQTTSFTANWTASSTPGVSYLLDVATDISFASFVSGYNAKNVGTNLSDNVTGLAASSVYYVRVRAVDGACYSAFSGTLTQFTECDPELAPTAVQDFSTFTGAAPPPVCWKEATGTLAINSTLSYTGSAWLSSTGFANTGSNKGVRINLYSTKNDWIISQPIDLGATPGLFRASYNMAVTSYLGTLPQSTLGTHKVDIVVSTDGGATWSNANVIKTYTGAGSYSNTGQIEKINLTGYSGVVKIAFVATTTSTSPDIDFHIDDFAVEELPEAPELSVIPASLAFGYVPSGGTSTEQTYSLSGIFLTGFPDNITVTAPAGFEVSLTSGAGFGSSVLVPYTAATLAPTTIYARFKPTSPATDYSGDITNAGGGAITKNVAVTGSSQLIYCSSAATNLTDEWITNVTFAGINNNSGSTGYSNFKAISGTVQQGETYPFSASIFIDGSYNEYVTVWIDWNQNGVFESSERTQIGTCNIDGCTVTNNIVVPADAILGNTVMRVNLKYAGYSTDPCETFTFGEVEDYTVIVTPGSSCLAPSNLAATSITSTSAELSWVPNGSEDSWNLEIGLPGFVPGTGNATDEYAGVEEASLLALGLDPETTYTFFVQAICEEDVSSWAGPYQFTTLELCPTPTAPLASGITATSANLGWTENGSATTWHIEYGVAPYTFTGTPSLTVNTNPYALTGLSANTPYQFKVRAVCGEDQSNWSVTQTFTTLCDVYSLPLSESFDGVTFPPQCWSRYSGLLANPSTLSPITFGWIQDEWLNIISNPDKAARLNIWSTSINYWLVTPQIDLGDGSTNYKLEFDLALMDYGTSNPPETNGIDDKFAVVISTDGGASWSSVNTLRLWDNAGSAYVYNNISNLGESVLIPLTGYTGVVSIGFYGESTISNADNDLMVNNVTIQELVYPVTFNVDMSTAVVFDHDTEVVYIAGDFPGATWNEPGTNPNLQLSRVGLTDVYTITLDLPPASYQYKYFRNAGWGGGEWTGGPNRSIAIAGIVETEDVFGGDITFANLQWPAGGTITEGGSFTAYGQAFIPNGITGTAGAAFGLEAWVGVSTDDTNPAGWSTWVPATFNGQAGDNDEFQADIASGLTPGTYYYAYRYRFGQVYGEYLYGGFSGGFWDGTTNVSGVLTVNAAGPPPYILVEGAVDDCVDATDEVEIVGATVENGAIADIRSGGIITATDFEVKAGGTAYLTAATSITLGDEVLITPGATGLFLAKIDTFDPCVLMRAIVAADEEVIPVIPAATSLFKVFPNPTTGSFKLELTSVEESSSISVEIFGMMGEKVFQDRLFGSMLYEFDLSNMPRGIYFIRVLKGDEMGIEKVIKQ